MIKNIQKFNFEALLKSPSRSSLFTLIENETVTIQETNKSTGIVFLKRTINTTTFPSIDFGFYFIQYLHHVYIAPEIPYAAQK